MKRIAASLLAVGLLAAPVLAAETAPTATAPTPRGIKAGNTAPKKAPEGVKPPESATVAPAKTNPKEPAPTTKPATHRRGHKRHSAATKPKAAPAPATKS